MDFAAEQLAQGLIDHPVLIDQTLPHKHGRYQRHLVVSAALAGAGVTGMLGAVILDLEVFGGKCFFKDLFDLLPSLGQTHLLAAFRPTIYFESVADSV